MKLLRALFCVALSIAALTGPVRAQTPGATSPFFGMGAGLPCTQGGNDSFTKILLHMDGGNGGTVFLDTNVGGSAHTWTASSATTSTSGPQFGTASMSGPYISTPDSANFTLGSGDFTVDFWFNTNGTGNGTQRYLAGQNDSSSNFASTSFLVFLSTQNTLQGAFGYSGGSFIAAGPFSPVTTAGWHHAAFVRNGANWTAYLDGVAGSPRTITGLTANDSANNMSVGRAGENASTPFTGGSIDEFRLSVGIARWTANFTPPTAAYCP